MLISIALIRLVYVHIRKFFEILLLKIDTMIIYIYRQICLIKKYFEIYVLTFIL